MPLPGLPYSDEQLFQSLNGCLLGWALLVLLPRWRLTVPIVTLMCCVYSALYVGCMAYTILQGPQEEPIDMFSYDGVARLLATRSSVLPAWTHYVVFDLWTGRWEVLDAAKRGVPQVLMVLPIALTCLLGPTGLLLYLLAIRPFFRPKPAAAGAKRE